LWTYGPEKIRNIAGNALDSRTLGLRLKYLAPAWTMFLESPLIGHGFGAYRSKVYAVQARLNELSGGKWFDNYPDPKPRRPHNEVAEILVDAGLLGLVAALVVVWRVVGAGVRAYLRDGDVVVICCLASAAALAINGMFFFPLRVNSTAFMAVLMGGILAGCAKED
jgi:O-antigen ligase